MVEMVLLAFLGGLTIAMNRVFIARLAMHRGALHSSLWNHIGGAVFVLVVLLVISQVRDLSLVGRAPLPAYFGGVIGALFVTITGFIIPRLGTMKATILIIGGQMAFGVLFDLLGGRLESPLPMICGVAIIGVGISLNFFAKKTSS